MCLVLTISQLYLMDVVLGNQFLHLGKHLFTYSDLTVALNRVFPIGEVSLSLAGTVRLSLVICYSCWLRHVFLWPRSGGDPSVRPLHSAHQHRQ